MFSALTSRTRKLSTSRSFHDKRLSTCTPNAPTDSSGGSPRSTTGFGDDAQAATQASTVANGPHSAQAEMLGGSSSSTSRHLHSSQSRAPAHQQQAEQHPYGHMSSSVRDNEEEEELCPVCLCELSLRLQGERPHVVPVCGHRLHHDCFEAVYGDVNRARIKTSSLGLCGVCRRDMKLGDGGEGPGKKNKFAALSGLPQQAESSSHKMRSATKGTLDEHSEGRHDPTEDDDLVQLLPSSGYGVRESVATGSTGSTVNSHGRRSSGGTMKGSVGSGGAGGGAFEIVKPFITVKAEHGDVERPRSRQDDGGDEKQHLTCMVTIEMPSRWPTPSPYLGADLPAQITSPSPYSPPPPQAQSLRPSSPTGDSVYSAYAFGATSPSTPDPFASVVEDLQARMADWKGHSPDEFGQLKLYDWINVRKDTNTREFLVYLFQEAILCVTDDKRKGLAGKIADGISGSSSEKLRLKGRVYVRHIRTVLDTSRSSSDLSLTIMMSDDALDEFVMTFKDRQSLDMWRQQIERLVSGHSNPPPPPPPREEASSKAMLQSRSNDSMVGSEYSGGSGGHLSSFSGYTRSTSSTAPLSAPIYEDSSSHSDYTARGKHHSGASGGPFSPVASVLSASSSFNNLSLNGPREVNFTPLDLMLILSVPSSSSGAHSLKLNILKSSLAFLLQHVGPRTRISLVTFAAGEGARGKLRKSPFIAVGKKEGRRRLEAIVEQLGREEEREGEGEPGLVEHREERVNVVTACNLALDIVLQRKVKSALTGMVLMNDGRDGAQKQQMDLVMARAEAANVPVHTLGWGKFHDPSSLWLLSNHTGGSYIFVKDFHDLRDALAGCIGGILSIAATNVRLHISVPERRWFRIRKVSGTPGAIVSTAGTDVDIEIGELRFGEKKDLLVEVEMSLAGWGGHEGREGKGHQKEFSTATDAFFLSRGLNPASLDDYSPTNLYDDEYDSMPDEVPLFEVNAAYRDPAAGKTVSRLNQSPCLLTITVIPPSGSERPPAPSAPDIVRRRMELLSSDMLSRALLLMTRRNDSQAKRLLEETKRIISTISGSLNGVTHTSSSSSQLHPPRSTSRRGSVANSLAQQTLEACAEDVGKVLEGCIHRDDFDSNVRYMAAQQAVVLRDQRAWTPKSATERLFWTADNSLWMVARSQQWVDSR